VSHHLRKACALCESGSLRKVLDLPPTPLANEFLETPGPQDIFPLGLLLCETCGHVQLEAIVDPDRLFRNYLYVSGTSPVTRTHFDEYAAQIMARPGMGMAPFVVEIGSNDGTFLKSLRKRGAKVLGVDPAVNLARAARADGINTISEFFTEKLAEQIVEEWQPADAVVANNVFAHAEDLRGIARGAKALIGDRGVFVAEVSYLVDVVEKMLFDTCLPEGSPIITKTGLCAIEAVKEGDEVLTHRGRFRRVTKTMKRPYVGSLCSIQIYGQSDPLRLTPEHPVYVRRGLGEFLEADKIVKGDTVLKPSLTERKKLPWLRLTSNAPGRGGRQTITRFRVTRDLMRVFGYYIAEGSYSVRGRNSASASFAFGKNGKEKALADDCASRIRRMGQKANVRLTEYGWHVETYGAMARLLDRELGHGAANKRVPAWVYEIGNGLSEELLHGYVLGDGYVYRGGAYWRATTVSEQLAQDVSLLGNKLGFAVSINRSRAVWKEKRIANNPRTTKTVLPAYDVLIRRTQATKIKVSFSEGYQHGTVRSVARELYSGSVFNLEVEDDNSYVTPQGAVHNCYHEHLSYHAVNPLARMFKSIGMKVVDAQRNEAQGGTLRLFAVSEKHPQEPKISVHNAIKKEFELGLFGPKAYSDLGARIEARGAILQWNLLRVKKEGLLVAGYGAPAKLTTLMHAFKMKRDDIAFIVDDAPLKQGRYTPGLHIPVYHPSSLHKGIDGKTIPDICVVFAWNFAKSIIEKNHRKGLRWIVPLPEYSEWPKELT